MKEYLLLRQISIMMNSWTMFIVDCYTVLLLTSGSTSLITHLNLIMK